jgi:uncharacterized protein
MSRPRIVIDTNVLISAALKPSGLEAQIVDLVARRAVELCISTEVFAEYCGVLSRPKFAKLGSEAVSRLLSLVASEATVVSPTARLNVSPDEDDNRFYECADAAHADYIVTGNLKHFPTSYKTASIVSARQLIGLLASDVEGV